MIIEQIKQQAVWGVVLLLILPPAHLKLTWSFLLLFANMEDKWPLFIAHLIQIFSVSFCFLTTDSRSVLTLIHYAAWMRINTVSLPEQFPVTNLQPSRLLLICHTQTADNTGKPDTAAHLGYVALKGNSHYVSIPSVNFPFYSNWLLFGVTHLFKSHFPFITSSFLPQWTVTEVTGSVFSSENATPGLSQILTVTARCVKVSPGTAYSSSIVFSWVVRPPSVTMAKSRLPEKEKGGGVLGGNAQLAKTTCWGDRSSLFSDISWHDSQLVWSCQVCIVPVLSPSPWAV